jgi:GNAT superfamily N-acetyltransferase
MNVDGKMLRIFAVDTERDLEAAKVLFAEYGDFLREELSEYAGLPWLREHLRDFEDEVRGLPGEYAAPKGGVLLAAYGGDEAGCVGLRRLSDGICEMRRLFVRPAYRRLGIGSGLCKALIERAPKMGYCRMRLDTVLEPAKALYRSLGFEEIEAYDYVPIEGAVFMELEL